MAKQIFFSHSSRDRLLIEEIKKSFKEINVKPYFAFLEQEGRTPRTKIEEGIYASSAIFLLVTQNVLNDEHTRDWVSYEVGFARGLQRGAGDEKRVYAWIINVDEEDELAYLKSITDYISITLKYEEITTPESGTEYRFDSEDINKLVQLIKDKASEIIKLQEIPIIEAEAPIPKKVLKLIPPTFEITQNLPNKRKREFPDVGFNIENPNNSPIRVKVLANTLLGQKDLGPLQGHYSGEKTWNLNPLTGVRGHFQIPEEAAKSQEKLEVKVKVTYIDKNNNVHDELLPVGYVYMRDQNNWYFEP